MDKNRELCELLWIPWHEHNTDCMYSPCYKSNPDFTTDAGKVMLLRTLRDRGDWHDFAKSCGVDEIRANSMFRIDYILDTAGQLRDRAIDFLKGRDDEIQS